MSGSLSYVCRGRSEGVAGGDLFQVEEPSSDPWHDTCYSVELAKKAPRSFGGSVVGKEEGYV